MYKTEKPQWLGIVMAILGIGMILSLPFTPKVIWNWFTPCSLGDCGNQPVTFIGNLQNAISHVYLYIMFFGGWLLYVGGLFLAISYEKPTISEIREDKNDL